MRRTAAVKRPYEPSGRSSSGRYDDGWESKRPATSDRYAMLQINIRNRALHTSCVFRLMAGTDFGS